MLFYFSAGDIRSFERSVVVDNGDAVAADGGRRFTMSAPISAASRKAFIVFSGHTPSRPCVRQQIIKSPQLSVLSPQQKD